MDNNMVVFDKPYPTEKIAEGMAVNWAVVNGACEECINLNQCASERDFKFPIDSPCMIKKAQILKEMKGGEG